MVEITHLLSELFGRKVLHGVTNLEVMAGVSGSSLVALQLGSLDTGFLCFQSFIVSSHCEINASYILDFCFHCGAQHILCLPVVLRSCIDLDNADGNDECRGNDASGDASSDGEQLV
jgi:hypothetical protein